MLILLKFKNSHLPLLADKLIEEGNEKEPEFRWRGDKVTRLEAFSDGVLAFAMTLRVVSLEVPKTFAQLVVVMRGFIALAILFRFFDWDLVQPLHLLPPLGVVTPCTVRLNSILLFVILFHVIL